MGSTAEPRRFNVKASISVLLAISIVAGTALWQSSARPASAQVDAWSCGVPAAASPSASPSAPAKPDVIPFTNGRLIVFAAASLTDAFTKMGDDIMAAHPDVLIKFNFAGSQTLVTQIAEGGASADVLALASPDEMTIAIESGVRVDSPNVFATNSLASSFRRIIRAISLLPPIWAKMVFDWCWPTRMCRPEPMPGSHYARSGLRMPVTLMLSRVTSCRKRTMCGRC